MCVYVCDFLETLVLPLLKRIVTWMTESVVSMLLDIYMLIDTV